MSSSNSGETSGTVANPNIDNITDSTVIAEPVTPTDAENSPVDQLDLLGELKKILNEIDNFDSTRPNAVSLNEDLNTEISGGPADATAYHDFYSLQIAFEEVWTSHVDKKIADQLRDIYNRAVKIYGDEFVDGSPTDLSEIDDIKEAMEQIRDAVAVRESANSDGSASYTNNNNGTRTIRHHANNDPGPSSTPDEQGRLVRLLKGVEEALKTGYKFDVFQPNSYNFGILVNYKQRWQPISYQVGNLVATIPLAPGQSQKVTKRKTTKFSRAEKEARKSVASRSYEQSNTSRADAEIVRKASSSSNFTMSSSSSIKAGIEMIDLNATRDTKFSYDQSNESAETKKHFREAVRKAASEYRDEHSIEVSTTRESEMYSETVTELSNPNNELSITYLFYELQRRYYVSEKLHGVTPVVLVALDVPSPDEIDEAWLLENEWIIRRVLLDDIYVESLNILAQGLVDSEIAANTLQAVLEGQAALVNDLKLDVQLRKESFEGARNELSKYMKKTEDKDGFFEKIGNFFVSTEDEHEALRNKTEAARQILDWTESDFTSLTDELRSAANSLQQAAQEYLKAVRELQRKRLAVDRLRLHVRQNILYYMQAIWAHTPPDQLYFQLYDIEIEWPEASGNPIVVGKKTVLEGLGSDGLPIEKEVLEYRFSKPKIGKKKPLYEVADIDRVLGYKGNYIILPLKKSNAITDIMLQPYRSDDNAIDPDNNKGNDPFDLLNKFECQIREINLSDNTLPDIEGIRKNIYNMFKNNKIEGETIIVPSGELYIEALPGKRPLLEDFKLKHRQIDSEIAHEDLKSKKLENLRWAVRLQEGLREDPDIDKSIHIQNEGDDDNTDIILNP